MLLMGLSLPSMAQVGEQRHNLAIGVNGGINLNTVSFQVNSAASTQPSIKQNMLMGITGGLTARYISEKYFAMICGLQMELNISQKGWEEAYELADGTKDLSRSYIRNMTYLEIPFLAHLAFGKDRGAQVFLNIGPQIAFLLGDSEDASGWTQEQMTIQKEYGKPIENKFDYGITGGLGLEIRTKKAGNFLLEGRYYFGLADFFKSTKKDPFARSANSTITVKLSYLFDLKK